MAQGKTVGALPRKAVDVLRWVLDHHRRTGYMPTIRETAAGFGFASHSGARYYLDMLQAHGYIVRTHGTARTLRVTPTGQQAAEA